MGYYTDYTLEIVNDANHELVNDKPTTIGDVIDWMKEAGARDEISNYSDDYDMLDSGAMNAKWYDHQEDMRKVSTAFPHLLLKLSGQGEEWDNQWHQYYNAGKVQTCQATITVEFPEFDASKLK